MQTENKNVMQRAEEALDYWDESTMWARLIERDISANDLEALEFHLKEADSEMEIMKHAEEFAKDFDLFVLGGEEPTMLAHLPRVPVPEGFEECQA